MSVLAGEGLGKTFGSGPTAYTALTDVNISLEASEVVVLLGPSGSGKTTLISVLAGLLRRSRGTVRLEGEVLCSTRSNWAIAATTIPTAVSSTSVQGNRATARIIETTLHRRNSCSINELLVGLGWWISHIPFSR